MKHHDHFLRTGPEFPATFRCVRGVGIDEAVLAPAAFSMISDLFAPEKRGRPMAAISMAYSIGGAGSAILAGLVWVPTLALSSVLS